jgi:hypothetical protein
MAALAFGLLAIIVVTGRPAPPVRPAPTPANQGVAPNPDRLRDYQDRLRVLDERSRQQAQASPIGPSAPVLYDDPAPPRVDPLQDDRRRREYESLFASNVVISRRAKGSTRRANRIGFSRFCVFERPSASELRQGSS